MNNTVPAPRGILRAWCVYPLLVPFYFMGKTPIPGTEKVEGGVPQLADFYLMGLFVLVFGCLPLKLSRAAATVLATLVAFVCYTGFVNMAWAVNLESLSMLKGTIYYAYDVLLLFTCLILYANYKEEFLRMTVMAVGASVVLQAVLSPLAPKQVYARQALFFNNENQLGYFCLLSATIVVFGTRRFSVPLRYQAPFYGALAYLALLAQSRTAIMGLVCLALVALIGRPLRLMLLTGLVGIVIVVLTVTPAVVSKSEERFVVQGEYDTLATRGYDRMVNYPEHLLLGAGEGAYERFQSDLFGSEIHSSYGTLLFCYGIPGTLLFTLAILYMCRRDLRIALFLIPAFIHGTGHQGLRFAFFWTMLAFLCCCGLAAQAEEPESETEPEMHHPPHPQPAT